jgi:hypothetical protein
MAFSHQRSERGCGLWSLLRLRPPFIAFCVEGNCQICRICKRYSFRNGLILTGEHDGFVLSPFNSEVRPRGRLVFTGFETCLDRCRMDAIRADGDGKAAVDLHQCTGCVGCA